MLLYKGMYATLQRNEYVPCVSFYKSVLIFLPLFQKDEIYAESTQDIGQIDDRKFANVKLTADFQSQLDTFDFKSLTG